MKSSKNAELAKMTLPKKLSLDVKRAIFRDLVLAQDQQQSVRQSRQAVITEYGISESDLLQIEEEGIEKGWPPL